MATSKLQTRVGELLFGAFPWFNIHENYRPDWLLSSSLTRLELDFYIEELRIAFEIQGRQHYEHIPFFHKSIEQYHKRRKYDEEKKDLCRGARIKLVEIFTFFDAVMEVEKIGDKFNLKAVEPEEEIEETIQVKDNGNQHTISKYIMDQSIMIRYGNPKATIEKKISEVEKFRRKLTRYYERMDKNNSECEIPYFKFMFLSYFEQCALLNEFDIQSKIFSSIGLSEPIPHKPQEKLDIFKNCSTEIINGDLEKWQRKAKNYLNHNQSAVCDFSSYVIPTATSTIIQDMLIDARCTEDIDMIFNKFKTT